MHHRFQLVSSLALRLLPAAAALLLAGCTSESPQPGAPKPGKPPTYSIGELVWREEFDYSGLPDPVKWQYDVGGSGWGNNELQYYTASRQQNARVENGNLVIEALREPGFGQNQYTSARLLSKASGGGSLTYGRVEVRAKVPAARGTWPAIWMLPDNWTYGNGGWPDNGEIDIMEHVGYDANVVHFSTHCNRYYFRNNNQKTARLPVPTATSDFHIYAMEWTPETITGYIDGQQYFTNRNEHGGWPVWPFDKAFHLVLNVAVGGDWGGAQGVDAGAFPQRMLVDYVRYYRLKEE